MENNKGITPILIVIIIIGVLALGVGAYYISTKNTPKGCTMEAKICPDGSSVGRAGPNCEFTVCPTPDWHTYRNDKYGFTLALLDDWQGYSVTESQINYGWEIVLRHPGWTEANPYEDIPILIYPIEQWTTWEATNFEGYPTAAPFGPTERGRNSLYVFATGPRYNYDFSIGYENVENIIKTLKAF